MTVFANSGVNRLSLHATLHQLSWSVAGVFSAVFLLHVGIALPGVFFAMAAILWLRLAARSMLPLLLRGLGLRHLLVLGTAMFAIQYPLLAMVKGLGTPLLLYCLTAAIANVCYWTSFHAYFSVVSDHGMHGSRVALRQLFSAVISVLGLAIGGFTFVEIGAWAAFAAGAVIEILSLLPLVGMPDHRVSEVSPPGAYSLIRPGVLLLATDGWIMTFYGVAWKIVLFQSLDTRFDLLGAVLALSASAGALGGVVFGRMIDTRSGRQIVAISGALLFVGLLSKALCGSAPVIVAGVAILTELLGGLYVPVIWRSLYREGKASPCPFRFQVIGEGAWEFGGGVSYVVAALLSAGGIPLQPILLLGLPAVCIQTVLLMRTHMAGENVTGA
jgi:hypothetical protein